MSRDCALMIKVTFDHRDPPWSTFSSNFIHLEVSLQTGSVLLSRVNSNNSINNVGGS